MLGQRTRPIHIVGGSRSGGDWLANRRRRSYHCDCLGRNGCAVMQRIVSHSVSYNFLINSVDECTDTVAFIGEFVGTTLFLFFAFAGTQVANIGSGNSTSTTGAVTGFNPATLLYIALCFGFSLMVNAWVFFRISGGLFNPAVCLCIPIPIDRTTFV